MKKYFLSFLCSFFSLVLLAQNGTVTGVVSDNVEPLIGVSIAINGTSKGTITDLDGSYSINLAPGNYTITASYVGYTNMAKQVRVVSGENTAVDFQLSQGEFIEEIVVVGTRAFGRTNTDSPVPIDVIDVAKLAAKNGQVSVTEILNVTAPSFTSQTQTVSDGTDHIDPASLRGLGPDQVLVLINGKRRHNSSLLNINGTVGAGSVGTDMNSIPAAAIRRIEVLRDGAAAQYGSDAIAGVINIVMKEETDGLELGVSTGANFSELSNHQEGGVDGEKVQIDASYGLPLGDKGGFINITGSLGTRQQALRNATNTEMLFDIDNTAERIFLENNPTSTIGDMTADDYSTILAGLPQNFIDAAASDDFNLLDDLELSARGLTREDFRFRVGTSQLREGKVFMNLSVPLSEQAEVYAFGGVGSREGLAFGFLREPHRPRANTAANFNGFLPGIQSNIIDRSLAFGIKGSYKGWDVDFSNTFGGNSFEITVVESTNASLGAASPSDFEAGAFAFDQNTSNLDFSKKHDLLAGFKTSFGAEYRLEQFSIEQGSENSFATFDNNGVPTVGGVGGATNAQGESLPGTSQVYGGFTPNNAISRSRNSIAGYADFELDATETVLLAAALRFEDYSDFGSTFNYKLAARVKASDNISLRGAFSTGFRAPSLHQQFFSRSSTIFDANGVAQEQGLFTNTSRAAELIGIDRLREETSQNISLGATAKFGGFSVTVDAYQINIDDRIILSGSFGDGGDPELEALFRAASAGSARFLVNAIDTKTQGIDVVVGYRVSGTDNKWSLNNNLAATFSTNEIENITVPERIANAGLSGSFFDGQEEAFLTLAQPRTKISLSNTLTIADFDISLRNVLYGEVTDPDDFAGDARVEGTEVSDDAVYDAKVITDLAVSYPITESFRLTLGANNLLDVYPTENRAGGQSNASFPFSRRTSQFGFTGRYMFIRANFNL